MSIEKPDLLSPKVGTPSRIKDSISITDLVSQKDKNQNSNDGISENLPNEDFSKEQLEVKWKIYKDKLNEEGKTNMAFAFKKFPEREGSTLIMSIENKTLEKEVLESKQQILDFLRRELKNYSLNLITKINTSTDSKKAYTPSEKFIKMSEKNPNLKLLAETFQMDIGYPKQQ